MSQKMSRRELAGLEKSDTLEKANKKLREIRDENLIVLTAILFLNVVG